MKLRLAAACALATLALLSSCGKGSGSPPQDAAPAASSSQAPAPAGGARIAVLLRAENQRNSAAVLDEDLTSQAVEVRRAAARALARADDPKLVDRLMPVLADADPDVLSWAAYGLGETCEANRDRIVRALIARSVSLAIEPAQRSATLDPWFALARALGACATNEAERTLDAWLDMERSRALAASLGIGDVATRHKRIDEESAAQLLRAASGDAAHDPLGEAFFPFGRLRIPPPRAAEQELEIAHARLGQAAPSRIFVVRALAKLGEPAIEDLSKVLTTTAIYTVAERSEAARGLAAIGGRKAQAALLHAATSLAPPPDPVALTALTGAAFHPLLAALDGLDPVGPAQGAALRPIAELPVPPNNAPATLTRRVVALRCAAARALAGANPDEPRLTACDPSHGAAEALSRITVIGRGKVAGPRLAAWRALLDDKQPPRVRQTALRLIATHPEIPDSAGILAGALESELGGVVATAAEIIAQTPESAATPARGKKVEARPDPDERVIKALTAALDKQRAPDDVEIVSVLARAAGTLRAAAAHKTLETLCKSHQPTLRDAAASALSAIDDKKVACEAAAGAPAPIADELGHLIAGPVKLEVKTDAGTASLTLDPTLAPVAATRIAELASKGFFAKNVVHRVVPGFVVQFGDPGADGWGGSGQPPLRCETSPVPFVEGTVGMALGGRDTGSSQIFITLAPAPHLDGHYAVIGKADGPWDAIAEGDVIEQLGTRN